MTSTKKKRTLTVTNDDEEEEKKKGVEANQRLDDEPATVTGRCSLLVLAFIQSSHLVFRVTEHSL